MKAHHHDDDDDCDEYGEEEFEENDDDVNTDKGGDDGGILRSSVDGLNLENYMDKMVFTKDNEVSQHDDALDGEQKPLDGVCPQSNEKEQILLRRKLGYSESAENFSPKKNVLLSSASGSLQQRNDSHLSWVEPTKQANSPSTYGNVDSEINALYLKISENVQSTGSNSNADSGSKKPLIDMGDAAANAARVDALLMELFPERMKEEKKKKTKKTKQTYGLGAVKDTSNKPHDIAYYINMTNGNQHQSRYGSNSDAAAAHIEADAHNSTTAGEELEQQVRQLRKDLKTKDDKLSRVTEHSLMMAQHVDRLKGEVALLTMRLRDADLELQAKESRLQEALKLRKKKNAAAGNANNDAAVGTLGHENFRLKEREQALMDAVEELSTQNQDLIVKLKQSMQRELELSSKRAALISSTVANMVTSDSSNYHLPNITKHQQHAAGAGGDGLLRAQSEPEQGNGGGKRSGVSKKKSAVK